MNMLNPAQMQAVKQIHGPVLILAGAGTGKTRVVTSRIAHMIDEGIKPDSILAVTFTNKAATEMRERVAGVVKKVHAELVTVSTFHSLCVKIHGQRSDGADPQDPRQAIDRCGGRRRRQSDGPVCCGVAHQQDQEFRQGGPDG